MCPIVPSLKWDKSSISPPPSRLLHVDIHTKLLHRDGRAVTRSTVDLASQSDPQSPSTFTDRMETRDGWFRGYIQSRKCFMPSELFGEVL